MGKDTFMYIVQYVETLHRERVNCDEKYHSREGSSCSNMAFDNKCRVQKGVDTNLVLGARDRI